jgi:hypothetical protein
MDGVTDCDIGTGSWSLDDEGVIVCSLGELSKPA